MDSIDFEVIKQLIKEKYPNKKEYAENLRLLYKRYMNSFYQPCASKYFYFYNDEQYKEALKKSKLMSEITIYEKTS